MALKVLCSLLVAVQIALRGYPAVEGLSCGSDVQVLSLNPAILNPAVGVVASYGDAENIVNFGVDEFFAWCTSTFFDDDRNINLTFTSPVLITGLISGGRHDTFGDEMYVNRFRMAYLENSADNIEDLIFYTYENNSDIDVADIDVYISIEQPFQAQFLHLKPVAWVDPTGTGSDICWSLVILGCPATQAFEVAECSEEETTTAPPPSSSSIAANTETPSATCPNVSPDGSMRVKDFQVLEIALPIVLIAIATVIAIVIVGVVICLRAGRNRYEEVHFNNNVPQSSNVKILDNSALYTMPSEDSAMERSRTIVKKENVLYYSSADSACRGASNPMEPTSNGMYEMVEKPPEDDDGMEDNLAYGDFPLSPNESYDKQATTGQQEGEAEYSYAFTTSVRLPSTDIKGGTNIYEQTS